MYNRVNYTVVGIFVLLFGTGLVWFAFWLGKYGMTEDYYTYKLVLNDSVAGLSEDADVMLRGVDIGHVTQIRINPDNIEQTEIFLQILQRIPVKEDMVASTKMFGVTGLLSIELEGGSKEAKTLQPTDDYIPVIKSKNSYVTTLSSNLQELSNKLNVLLAQTEKLFSDDNIEKIGQILDNVEKVTLKGETSLDELQSSLQQFKTTMQTLNSKVDGAGDDVTAVKKVLVPMIENSDRVMLKVEQSLDRGDYNLKKMLQPILVDLQNLTSQMNDLARQMEQSPNDLLFKSRKPLKGPGE